MPPPMCTTHGVTWLQGTQPLERVVTNAACVQLSDRESIYAHFMRMLQ